MYQLCLGTQSLDAVVDRVVARSCRIVPGLDADACRRLVELVFAARVRMTDACGKHPECEPGPPVWDGAEPYQGDHTCGWTDLDPEAVPAMYGASAVALLDAPRSRCARLEELLADEMRQALESILFHNPRCGHAAICKAAPVFPLRRQG